MLGKGIQATREPETEVKAKRSPEGEGKREHFSNFTAHTNHLRELVKMQILIWKVRARAQDSAFPTSSQVRLMLLIQGLYFM